MKHKKHKIVNMKKFIRTITMIILFIIFLLFLFINSTYSKGELKYKEEYIYESDTLWSIAAKEAKENEYYANKDIRDIISEIRRINNIENTNLKIGQKIKIPTI